MRIRLSRLIQKIKKWCLKTSEGRGQKAERGPLAKARLFPPPKRTSFSRSSDSSKPNFIKPYQPASVAPKPRPAAAPAPSPVFSEPVRPATLPKIDHSFRPEMAKRPMSAVSPSQPRPFQGQNESQNFNKSSAFPSPKADRLPNQDSSKPSFEMQFFSPYPTPEKHEVQFDNLPVPPASTVNFQQDNVAPDQSPIKLKGFTEGPPPPELPPLINLSRTSRRANTSASVAHPKNPVIQKPIPEKRPAFTPPPPHPKNIIYPHYRLSEEDEKPEVRIEGNLVDLSGKE